MKIPYIREDIKCSSGKIVFGDFLGAKRYARKTNYVLKSKGKKTLKKVYYCSECKNYHLSSLVSGNKNGSIKLI